MRRSYQKWAAEKRKESGPAPNWDGFVESLQAALPEDAG